MNFEEEAKRLLDALKPTYTPDELKLTILVLEKAFIAGKQEAVNQAMAIIKSA